MTDDATVMPAEQVSMSEDARAQLAAEVAARGVRRAITMVRRR